MSAKARLANLTVELAKMDGICTRQMGRIAELCEMLRRAEWWISTKPDGARMAQAIRACVDCRQDDGTCIRCGAAPRGSSGLCATCLDEDAVRAGEVDPPGNALGPCPECGAPAGMDCRTIQGRIPPHESRRAKAAAIEVREVEG